MSTLRSKLIRLAHSNPELRAELLPMLKSGAAEKTSAGVLVMDVKNWLKDFDSSKKEVADLAPLLYALAQYSNLILHDTKLRTLLLKAEEHARGEASQESMKLAASPLDRARGHQLMPAAIKSKIPKLNSQENNPDSIAWVKFFSPYSNAVWYITEFDGRDQMFGWGELFPGGGELGYISLSELEEAASRKGLPLVERDTSYRPAPLSKFTE